MKSLTARASAIPINLRAISFADAGLVVFGILAIIDIVFGFNMSRNERLFLEFAVAFPFTTSVHVIFPLWMIERSEDFRRLTINNAGPIAALRVKLALIAAAFFALVFFLYYAGSDFAIKTFIWAQALWGTWHYLTQTRGLYYASTLDQPKEAFQSDLKVLKYFVILLFITRGLRTANLTYDWKHEAFGKLVYNAGLVGYAVCTVMFIYLMYNLLRRKSGSKKQVWTLSRFVLWLLTFATPVSAFGTNAVHGGEYYDITRKVRTQSQRMRVNRAFSVGFMTCLTALGVCEVFKLTNVTEGYHLIGSALVALSMSLSMTHFLLDGWIYKMKTEESRIIMKRLLK